MNKLFFSFIFLISLNVYSQVDKSLEFEIKPYKPSRVEESTKIDIGSYNQYYYRTGFSLGEVNSETGNLSLGGVGMKSFSNSLFNSIEYSTHHGIEDLKISSFGLQLGYQFFNQSNKKIKPHLGGGFGYSSIKDTNSNRPSSNGIHISGDFGFEFFKINFLSLTQGFKFYKFFFEKENYKDSSIQELYLQINFRF